MLVFGILKRSQALYFTVTNRCRSLKISFYHVFVVWFVRIIVSKRDISLLQNATCRTWNIPFLFDFTSTRCDCSTTKRIKVVFFFFTKNTNFRDAIPEMVEKGIIIIIFFSWRCWCSWPRWPQFYYRVPDDYRKVAPYDYIRCFRRSRVFIDLEISIEFTSTMFLEKSCRIKVTVKCAQFRRTRTSLNVRKKKTHKRKFV